MPKYVPEIRVSAVDYAKSENEYHSDCGMSEGATDCETLEASYSKKTPSKALAITCDDDVLLTDLDASSDDEAETVIRYPTDCINNILNLGMSCEEVSSSQGPSKRQKSITCSLERSKPRTLNADRFDDGSTDVEGMYMSEEDGGYEIDSDADYQPFEPNAFVSISDKVISGTIRSPRWTPDPNDRKKRSPLRVPVPISSVLTDTEMIISDAESNSTRSRKLTKKAMSLKTMLPGFASDSEDSDVSMSIMPKIGSKPNKKITCSRSFDNIKNQSAKNMLAPIRKNSDQCFTDTEQIYIDERGVNMVNKKPVTRPTVIKMNRQTPSPSDSSNLRYRHNVAKSKSVQPSNQILPAKKRQPEKSHIPRGFSLNVPIEDTENLTDVEAFGSDSDEPEDVKAVAYLPNPKCEMIIANENHRGKLSMILPISESQVKKGLMAEELDCGYSDVEELPGFEAEEYFRYPTPDLPRTEYSTVENREKIIDTSKLKVEPTHNEPLTDTEELDMKQIPKGARLKVRMIPKKKIYECHTDVEDLEGSDNENYGQEMNDEQDQVELTDVGDFSSDDSAEGAYRFAAATPDLELNNTYTNAREAMSPFSFDVKRQVFDSIPKIKMISPSPIPRNTDVEDFLASQDESAGSNWDASDDGNIESHSSVVHIKHTRKFNMNNSEKDHIKGFVQSAEPTTDVEELTMLEALEELRRKKKREAQRIKEQKEGTVKACYSGQRGVICRTSSRAQKSSSRNEVQSRGADKSKGAVEPSWLTQRHGDSEERGSKTDLGRRGTSYYDNSTGIYYKEMADETVYPPHLGYTEFEKDGLGSNSSLSQEQGTDTFSELLFSSSNSESEEPDDNFPVSKEQETYGILYDMSAHINKVPELFKRRSKEREVDIHHDSPDSSLESRLKYYHDLCNRSLSPEVEGISQSERTELIELEESISKMLIDIRREESIFYADCPESATNTIKKRPPVGKGQLETKYQQINDEGEAALREIETHITKLLRDVEKEEKEVMGSLKRDFRQSSEKLTGEDTWNMVNATWTQQTNVNYEPFQDSSLTPSPEETSSSSSDEGSHVIPKVQLSLGKRLGRSTIDISLRNSPPRKKHGRMRASRSLNRSLPVLQSSSMSLVWNNHNSTECLLDPPAIWQSSSVEYISPPERIDPDSGYCIWSYPNEDEYGEEQKSDEKTSSHKTEKKITKTTEVTTILQKRKSLERQPSSKSPSPDKTDKKKFTDKKSGEQQSMVSKIKTSTSTETKISTLRSSPEKEDKKDSKTEGKATTKDDENKSQKEKKGTRLAEKDKDPPKKGKNAEDSAKPQKEVEDKITKEKVEAIKRPSPEKKTGFLGKTIQTIKKPFQDKSEGKEKLQGKDKKKQKSIESTTSQEGEEAAPISKKDERKGVKSSSTPDKELTQEKIGDKSGKALPGLETSHSQRTQDMKPTAKEGTKVKDSKTTKEAEGTQLEEEGKEDDKNGTPKSPPSKDNTISVVEPKLEKVDQKPQISQKSTKEEKAKKAVDKNGKGKSESPESQPFDQKVPDISKRGSVTEVVEKTAKVPFEKTKGETKDKTTKESPPSSKPAGKQNGKGKGKQGSSKTPSFDEETGKPQKSGSSIVGKAVEVIKKPFQQDQSKQMPSSEEKKSESPILRSAEKEEAKTSKQMILEEQKVTVETMVVGKKEEKEGTPQTKSKGKQNEKGKGKQSSPKSLSSDEEGEKLQKSGSTIVEKAVGAITKPFQDQPKQTQDSKEQKSKKGKQKFAHSAQSPSSDTTDSDKTKHLSAKESTKADEVEEGPKGIVEDQSKGKRKNKPKSNEKPQQPLPQQEQPKLEPKEEKIEVKETPKKQDANAAKDDKKKGKGKNKQKGSPPAKSPNETTDISLSKDKKVDQPGMQVEEVKAKTAQKSNGKFGKQPTIEKAVEMVTSSILAPEKRAADPPEEATDRTKILVKELSMDKNAQIIESSAIELVSKPLEDIAGNLKFVLDKSKPSVGSFVKDTPQEKCDEAQKEAVKQGVTESDLELGTISIAGTDDRVEPIDRDDTKQLKLDRSKGAVASHLIKELSQEISGDVIEQSAIDLVAKPLEELKMTTSKAKADKKADKMKDTKKEFAHIQKTIDDAMVKLDQFVEIVSDKASKQPSDEKNTLHFESRKELKAPSVNEGFQVKETSEGTMKAEEIPQRISTQEKDIISHEEKNTTDNFGQGMDQLSSSTKQEEGVVDQGKYQLSDTTQGVEGLDEDTKVRGKFQISYGLKEINDIAGQGMEQLSFGVEKLEGTAQDVKAKGKDQLSDGSTKISDFVSQGKEQLSFGVEKLAGTAQDIQAKGKDQLRDGSTKISDFVSQGKEQLSFGVEKLEGTAQDIQAKGKDQLSDGSKKISDVVSQGKEQLSFGVEKFEGTAQDIQAKGKDQLGDGSTKISDFVSQGKEQLSFGVEKLEGTAQDLQAKGKDQLSDGSKKISDVVSQGKEQLSFGVEKLEGTAQSIKAKGKDQLDDGSKKISGVVSQGKEQLSFGVEKLEGTAQDIQARGKDQLSDTSKKISGVVSQGKEQLSFGVEKLEGTAQDIQARGKDQLSDGSTKISDFVSQGKEQLSFGVEKLEGTAQDIQEKGKDQLSDGSKKISDVVSQGKEQLSFGAEKLEGTARDIQAKGKDQLRDGSKKISEIVGQGKEQLSSGLEKLEGTAQDIRTKGKDQLSEGANKLGGMAKGIFSRDKDLLTKSSEAESEVEIPLEKEEDLLVFQKNIGKTLQDEVPKPSPTGILASIQDTTSGLAMSLKDGAIDILPKSIPIPKMESEQSTEITRSALGYEEEERKELTQATQETAGQTVEGGTRTAEAVFEKTHSAEDRISFVAPQISTTSETFRPELHAKTDTIDPFETLDTQGVTKAMETKITTDPQTISNDEIGRIIKEMESQLLKTEFEGEAKLEGINIIPKHTTSSTTQRDRESPIIELEDDEAKPYITTPTQSRRVIGIGGSQRLSQSERPVVRVITEYVGDSFENVPEDDSNYTVLEPEVKERRKFKIRFSPDMYESEEREEVEGGGIRDPESEHGTATQSEESTTKPTDSRAQKKMAHIERRFERMTSQTKEADPSMTEVTDGEFQRIVSQLSLEEMDQALHQWDIGGLTPSEVDSKDLTLSSEDTISPLQQGLSDIFRPKLSSILPTPVYLEKSTIGVDGSSSSSTGATESIKMKLSLVKDSVPDIFQSIETDSHLKEGSHTLEPGETGETPPVPPPRTPLRPTDSHDIKTDQTKKTDDDDSKNYASRKMFWEQMSSGSTETPPAHQDTTPPIPKPRVRSSLSQSIDLPEEKKPGSHSDASRDQEASEIGESGAALHGITTTDSVARDLTKEGTISFDADTNSELEFIKSHDIEELSYDNDAFDDGTSKNVEFPEPRQRKGIYERSISLPGDSTIDSSSNVVRTKKRVFEAQIKKEMVVEQLMSQMEEEGSPEHKSFELKDEKPADQAAMLNRQIHSEIVSHELEEQIETNLLENKALVQDRTEKETKFTDAKEYKSTIAEGGSVGLSKTEKAISEESSTFETKITSTMAEILHYKTEAISKPSESLEVHVDKSEIEDTEKVKEIDEELRVIEENQEIQQQLATFEQAKVSSITSSQGESEDTFSESDVTPEDARFKEQQDNQVWGPSEKEFRLSIDKSDEGKKQKSVHTPEEHIPDTVWEVPVQESTENLEEETVGQLPVQMVSKPQKFEALTEREVRKIAEEFVDEIESELIKTERVSQDICDQEQKEQKIKFGEIKEKIKSEQKIHLVRTDTTTSSMEITDEELRSSGMTDDSLLESQLGQVPHGEQADVFGEDSGDDVDAQELDKDTIGKEVVDKTLAEVKQSLEAVKEELIEEKKKKRDSITKESPSEFEFKSLVLEKSFSESIQEHHQEEIMTAETKTRHETTSDSLSSKYKHSEVLDTTSKMIEHEITHGIHTTESQFVIERQLESHDILQQVTEVERSQMIEEEHKTSFSSTESSSTRLHESQRVSIGKSQSSATGSEISLESSSSKETMREASIDEKGKLPKESGTEKLAEVLPEKDAPDSQKTSFKHDSDSTGEPVIECEERKSPLEDVFSTSSSSDNKGGSNEGTALDKPSIIIRKHKKSLAVKDQKSDGEMYSSSGSHYESFEQTSESIRTPGSRPLSSDIEGLVPHVTGVTAGSSEYESALSHEISGQSTTITSREYQTAVSSLSSRDSMKSLDSESSGNLASVEVSSEASETLVPSAMELEKDIEEPVMKHSKIPHLPSEDQMKVQSFSESIEQSASFDISGEEISEDEEMQVLVDQEMSQRMKRSHEMTFQPEPRPIVLDEEVIQVQQEKLNSSLDDMSSLVSSTTDTAGRQTVIELSKTESERMDGSATSEQLSLTVSGTSDLMSLSESKEEAVETILSRVETIATQSPPSQQSSGIVQSVTITTSSIVEQGIQSVCTQVTSKVETRGTSHSNGPTQVDYNAEYDEGDHEIKKRGHRRNGSTSFRPSMIPVFQGKDIKSTEKKAEDIVEDSAESDKYANLLTMKEGSQEERKDVDETEKLEEESYKTEADQAMNRDLREGRISFAETTGDSSKSFDSSMGTKSRLPSTAFSEADSEIAELLKQCSSDIPSEDPIERPKTPEPEDSELKDDTPEFSSEAQASVTELEMEYSGAFSRTAEYADHVSPIREKDQGASKHWEPSLDDDTFIHSPDPLHLGFDDSATEKHELETQETKEKLLERSKSPVPDITVTQHMHPSPQDSFENLDIEAVKSEIEEQEQDIAKSKDAPGITDESKVTDVKSGRKGEDSASESPTSDSFELLEKPDIADEFVIIEEVGREASEQDTEGKSIKIDRKRVTPRAEGSSAPPPIISPPTTQTKLTQIKYFTSGATEEEIAFEFESGSPAKSSKSEKESSQEGSPPSAGEPDFKPDLEASKKWMEMQFQGEQAAQIYGYDIEYDRGPLEDIIEEDINDLAGSSKIGSMGSQVSQSIGSFGSVKESLSSTPDYDVLAGRKFFTRSGEHDDVSMSSLQEFERLEHLLAMESGKHSKSLGSQDSLTSSSNSRKHGSKSGGDDISLASLKEFEGLESACIAAETIEKKAKAEEESLLSEIEEGHESQASESESCATISVSAMQRVESDEDDYERRMFEIDEIIRQAQTNVEQFMDSKNRELLESSLLKSETLGRADSLEEISKVPELDLDQPLYNVGYSSGKSYIQQWDDLGDDLVTSTDSLELKTQKSKTSAIDPFTTSTDSLEVKISQDVMSVSTDSIEASQKAKKKDIMTDSIEVGEKTSMVTSVDSLEGRVTQANSIDEDELHATGIYDQSSSSGKEGDFSSSGKEDSAEGAVGVNRMPPPRAEYLLGSTDSLEPTSSTATHATYQYETDSVMSSSFTSGDSTTMVDDNDEEATARASMWYDEGKPYVTEIIEPIIGDEEFSHVVHRKVEMPPEIHKVSFKGGEAEDALREYIEKFDPGEDCTETREVDEYGNVHVKRVIQKRVIVRPEELGGNTTDLTGPELEKYLQNLTHSQTEAEPFIDTIHSSSGSHSSSVTTIRTTTTLSQGETIKCEQEQKQTVETQRRGSRPPLKYDISVDEEPEYDPREHDWRFNLHTHLERDEESQEGAASYYEKPTNEDKTKKK